MVHSVRAIHTISVIVTTYNKDAVFPQELPNVSYLRSKKLPARGGDCGDEGDMSPNIPRGGTTCFMSPPPEKNH